MTKIVCFREGKVTVERCVVARGYHLRLRCYLKENNLSALPRRELLQQFMRNTERVLDGLSHPGYHRVEELVNTDGTYYLRLLPITKATVKRYINEFENKSEGYGDLTSSLDLIEDEKVREKLFNIVFDMMSKEAEQASDEE